MPSHDAYINGQNLLHYMKRISYSDSILPKRLFIETGIILEHRGSSEVLSKGSEGIKTRYYKAREQIYGTRLDIYRMSFNWNSGIDISISIDESKVCITEGMVVESMGRGRFGRSTLRHFRPGEIPPNGLRPTHDSISYTFKNNVNMSFGFDYSCASGIDISVPADNGWEPPEDPIALQIEGALHGSVVEYLNSPYDKVVEALLHSGFECSDDKFIRKGENFSSQCLNKKYILHGDEYTSSISFQGIKTKNMASQVYISIMKNPTDEDRR